MNGLESKSQKTLYFFFFIYSDVNHSLRSAHNYMVPSKYLSATTFKGSLAFNLESSCGAPAQFRNVSRVKRPASIHSDTG